MGRLAGKVALVTGAASLKGFGFATARMFAAEGARVVLTDLNADAVEARAEELRAQGWDATGCGQDVTQQDSWDHVRHLTVAMFGRLDILVNNAGMVTPGGIADASLEDWNRHIAVNLTSVFLGCQMAVRQMLRQDGGAQRRGGTIINISSIAGIGAFPGLAAYVASKGGVRLLTKSAALDVAADAIRINSVHPGHLDTDMIASARAIAPQMIAAMEANVPMGMLGVADDIATMNLFLASDESRYITGAEFIVDGGLTAK